MTVGDRATFHTDGIGGKSDFAGDDDRNRGESFIDLDALERENVPSGTLQCLFDRRNGAEAEHAGLDCGDPTSNEASRRGNAVLFSPGLISV